MQDNTVDINRKTTPSTITYASTFNVAVPFIDRHLGEGRADKIAIQTSENEKVTFGNLANNVNRSGNLFKSAGLSPGARILIIVKDSPEFYFLFWGAIKAGFIPVPINTLLRAKDYQFMLEDSACEAVIYSPEFSSEVNLALEQSQCKKLFVLCTDVRGQTFSSQLIKEPKELEASPAKADSECFWLYSSGTTGTPKGTVHRHRDMVVTSEFYGVGVLGLKKEDVCFSAAKLFFAYGLGNAMSFPLWVGASAILYPGPPSPDLIFNIIMKFKPTIFFGVPTLYASQLRYLEKNSLDISSLRVCVSAGEALPANIFTRWKGRTGLLILDGIGSTEALHIFISNQEGDYQAGSSGRLVPGYEAKIIGENGKEVLLGKSGQLMISGASTASRYWNNPDKTRQTMVGEWLNTGDTYVQDEKGYFVYCGRNDDMLKVGGIWCSPFEIEAKLIEHPQVLEAAVIGREDSEGLVKPEAFIVLDEYQDASEELKSILLNHCKNGLAKYKYPRWINFLVELPKTATGKIQRFKLR